MRSINFITRFYSSVSSLTVCDKSLANVLPLNFIDGCRVESSGSSKYNVNYPSSGTRICSVTESDERDVSRAIHSANKAFGLWSKKSCAERGAVLRTAAQQIREKLEEFAMAECLDTGKPIWEARLDILGCIDTLDYFAGVAQTLRGDHYQLADGSWAYTRREPLGVCGCIGAWNFPFQMATWKSAPALAAGNTVVFKPSQLTPVTAVMLAESYKEAGLPDGCYNVVQGAVSTGAILANSPDINKLSFTGSVPTGSKIMAACSQNITPITLELGGKSPLIIFGDADIGNAVKGTMLANFLTQGQVCSNGTRVYVHSSIYDEFLERLVRRVSEMKIGDPLSEDTTVGAMISDDQGSRVMNYIHLAQEEGCSLACGGERVHPTHPVCKGGFYISPTVLTGCTDNMRVVREEIFGPVVAVMKFEGEDEVVSRANDSIFGLAAGLFTRDLTRAHRVASRLEAGTVYINNYNIYPPVLPFGGYKKSGIGRENGLDVFHHYTQLKTVYVEMNDVDSPI